MKAAIITQHGGPEVVEIADVPQPPLPADHVLLAVKAAGLNHLDLWVRRGLPGLPPKFPHIGGSDVAGTVAELGSDVERFTVGDRVLVNPGISDGVCEWCRNGQESLCVSYRLLGEHVDGGLSEFVSVPARNLLPLPDGFAFEDAAAIPLVFQTAWRALLSRARLQQGETVLITGASGGVSTAAIQIAKLVGATVFAVTAGPEKVRRVRELGADVIIDRLETDFSSEVWDLTEKRGVDVILDSVGEAIWDRLLRVLARDGRLVTYGATTGAQASIDIRRLFWKQQQIIGSTMASRSEFEAVMALVFEGTLKPVIDVVWPLDRAKDAHERLEAGQHFGNIILTLS